ncbi:hypothetical protein KY328_04605 [Candidatus Woesearchaeota archaeon]|nr:hypothetical protein [Candidatus Woesearchaeota archaeon]MBW3022180.1 hypothetical protein [Candidatus Woesearchaeota archaeon]
MKTKHIFVPALDVGELLPFAVKKTKTLAQNFAEQERSKKELVKFIDKLQKNFREPVWYMGMDVIGEKSYERFMFDKGGFFEVMIENPIAMNGHFVHGARAKRFKNALVKTLKGMMPKGSVTDIFLNSIEVQDEDDAFLTVQEWNKLKNVRKG